MSAAALLYIELGYNVLNERMKGFRACCWAPLSERANGPPLGRSRLVGFLNDRISQDVDMVTLRVNYRFGGYAAPGTARY